MKLFLTVFFLLVLYRQTAGTVTVYIYVTTPMACKEALDYCQTYYKDMFTINSERDIQIAQQAAGGAYDMSWFKLLSQTSVNPCTLMDYEESKKTTSWVKVCGTPLQLCSSKHPFFCYEDLIPLQVNKTWEEALVYCRSNYVDLAYLDNKALLSLSNVQADNMWTGLRFLAGKWFWVGKENTGINIGMPPCPIEPYRCGTLNTKNGRWENKDCEEKLNFLCKPGTSNV